MRRFAQFLTAASALVLGGQAFAAGKIDDKSLAALTAMKGLNLIVLGDWTAAHEVEGKAWAGGNVIGGGQFNVGAGGAGVSGASTYSTLTVIGNLTGSVEIKNNSGANGNIGRTVTNNVTDNSGSTGMKIGGNVNGTIIVDDKSKITVGGGFQDQSGNAAGSLSLPSFPTSGNSSVMVNGQMKDISDNAQNVTIQGASYTGNFANGLPSGSTATFNAPAPSGNTPGSGWSFGQTSQQLNAPTTASMATDKSTMVTNMTGLVSQLASLPKTGSVATYGDSQNHYYLFDAADTSNGYSTFSITAAQLAQSGTLVGFDTHGSNAPIVVNVTGVNDGTFTWNLGQYTGNGGAWNTALSSQIIWNLVDATANSRINISNLWEGSILDPLGTIANSTAIEGTIVAGTFLQGGEVHLGTFEGNDTTTTSITALSTTVPEPATWAMMVLGFGAVGSTIRRRRPAGRTNAPGIA